MARQKLPEKVQEMLDELYKSSSQTNKKKVDELTRYLHSSMIPAEQGGEMHVESMVGSKDSRPLVIFSWGSNRGELTPIVARGYALQILSAAEAAVQDAVLYNVVTKNGGDEKQAFSMINAVRNERSKFDED